MSKKHRGYNPLQGSDSKDNKGKKSMNNNSGSYGNYIHCHFYTKPRHSTNQCYKTNDILLGRSSNPNLKAMVAETQSNSVDNISSWILDSSTSHYLTSDGSFWQDSSSYSGTDIVGNGSSLSIVSYGHGTLLIHNYSLKLPHFFHTPHISHNLLFVQQLYADNDKIVELYSFDFFCQGCS